MALWSDETKTELLGLYDHCYGRRNKREACGHQSTIPTVKYDGGSIMLWGFATEKTEVLHKSGGIVKKKKIMWIY